MSKFDRKDSEKKRKGPSALTRSDRISHGRWLAVCGVKSCAQHIKFMERFQRTFGAEK